MKKNHILDQIKRTAELNNGIPLGKSRFLKETGIRESDWVGKFWLRWADAVKEAGYEPNALQKAYDVPDGHPKSPTCGHLKIPHPA